MKKHLYLFVVLSLLLSSCGSVRNFNYFQDTKAGDISPVTNAMQTVKIKPHDKISIIVSCKDPVMASMYNLLSSTNRVGSTSAQSTGYGYISYYTVDDNGEIDFPILGKMMVAGLSRSEIATTVKQRLTTSEQGLKDATITVEYADLHVGVLGEVKTAGVVAIDRDQFTILDALERAGDLTQYGNRKNVKVFRKENGSIATYEVDLTQFKELCASPVYMLQQDDVIYVEPNKVKARQSTAVGNTILTPTFWMSTMSFAVTMILLFTK